MLLLPGDIYIAAGLFLLAVALYLLRTTPEEVAKRDDDFFANLYEQDSRR